MYGIIVNDYDGEMLKSRKRVVGPIVSFTDAMELRAEMAQWGVHDYVEQVVELLPPNEEWTEVAKYRQAHEYARRVEEDAQPINTLKDAEDYIDKVTKRKPLEES